MGGRPHTTTAEPSQTAVGENGCRVSKRVAYCASAVVVKKKQEGKKTPLFGRGRRGEKRNGERRKEFPLFLPLRRSWREEEGAKGEFYGPPRRRTKNSRVWYSPKQRWKTVNVLIRNGSELCPVTLQPLPWIG